MNRRTRAIALLIALIVIGCGPGPSPTSSAVAGPSSGATMSAPAVGEGWARIALPPAADGQVSLSTVVATSGAYVIAGAVDGRTAAWSSPDGLAWHEERLPDAGLVSPTDAVAWGDRTLVMGLGEIGRPCARGTGLAAFVRDGAGSWANAPFDERFCDWAEAQVAVAGERAIVVGLSRGDSALGLVLVDGLDWADIHGRFGLGPPTTVASTPLGVLAFGIGPDRPWVQRSEDGVAWTDPVLLPVPDGSRPLAAAVLDNRIVAVVADGSGPVFALTSTDAVTWSTEPAAGLDARLLGRVEATPTGIIAVELAEHGTQRLLITGDGATWRELALPDGMSSEERVNDWLAAPAAILVGGRTRGEEPVAWIGSSGLLAP